MNLGKLSGLKGLVSHSSGKRRFKGDLTPDMISPPLGDFRHTMHVGRGGDVFGDTSFLSNHGGVRSAGDADSITASEKSEGIFSRTLRHIRKTPDRPQRGSKALSPPPPPISPIIKNAVSLPRLDMDSPNNCPVKVLFPSTPKPPENSTCSYGIESGFVTLPRILRTDHSLQGSSPSGCSTQIHRSSLTDMAILNLSCSGTLSPSDSITSFTVDLGPSLMSEVFTMINSPNAHQEINNISEVEHEPEAPFGLANGNAGMGLHPRTSLVDSLLREDSEGLSCLYDVEWGYKDVMNSETPKRPIVGPGDQVRSYTTEEHGMEAERFQMAANVLARHYGSGTEKNTNMNCCQKRRPYTYPDEEEEIKV
ncbi:cdc42 effector protein 1 [Colossoma macropomum]|uniref:cdc42 effector protein 1 n=1 Tax=Colossoma macropomum TaxID=42526 RepID=UPI0018640178|nr:cdc42 effector protein 1 [Colossoma macropomum]